MNQKNILFVGLGGHAGRIVSKIKKGLMNFEDSNNLHYLLIDLERYYNLENTIIDEHEYIFFGGINPKQYVNDVINEGSDSENFKELNTYFPIDQSYFIDSLPNRPLEKGAGRKRMVGRLMLYSKRQLIENKINKLLKKLDPKNDTSSPNVVVVSSSCGGTGSSIFYDVLNLFSSPSINLYPVVIGPSMLVEKNKQINIQLANKIKMNAMAFFEELSFYNRFPKYNFSFFSNKSTSLNLRYIIFFDNFLSETSRVAKTKLSDFEYYISTCVTLLFNGGYKGATSQNNQDIWADIENISEDMLNELKEIKSNAVTDLLEYNNYISFGYSENKSKENELLDVLKLITGQQRIIDENKIHKNDLLKIIQPELFDESRDQENPWENLKNEFSSYNNLSASAIYSKYIKDFVEKTSQPPSVNKYISLETIKKYLIEMKAIIPSDREENEENEEDEDTSNIPFISQIMDFFGSQIKSNNNDQEGKLY